MMFDHYILTRFNLGLYDKHPDPEAWMEERIALFERYTFPSMMRQTCMDWTWVIVFDELTPPEVIVKYDYVDNITIISDLPATWLRQNVDGDKWLITTRLDNDDYVERDLMENIQGAFVEDVLVVDTRGRALDTQTGIYYDPMREFPNSMFLSMIEHGRDCRTCHFVKHTDMIARFPSRKLDAYGWTMVCHGNNLMNSILPKYTKLPNHLQIEYANG